MPLCKAIVIKIGDKTSFSYLFHHGIINVFHGNVFAGEGAYVFLQSRNNSMTCERNHGRPMSSSLFNSTLGCEALARKGRRVTFIKYLSKYLLSCHGSRKVISSDLNSLSLGYPNTFLQTVKSSMHHFQMSFMRYVDTWVRHVKMVGLGRRSYWKCPGFDIHQGTL